MRTFREAAAIPRRRMAYGLTMHQIEALSDDLPAISKKDIEAAVSTTRPTVTRDNLLRHEEWSRQFGSEI